MTVPALRTRDERRADTLARFERDVDCWVASATPDGVPYLVPLSYLWDGETFLLSTVSSSSTALNLVASGRTRLAFGATRDVVLVEGEVIRVVPDDATASAFAAATGFDPREEPQEYAYLAVRPLTVQAWREGNELAGRTLMRDGAWL
ncbi:pyridoxamine 5'-phosphate oxidase family protein [Luteimicrobium sp. DT211]|uniref:pyridoxamine 5'-phosphate oxidase family protein n=1 Tax=Luteimicrobium sp. DT211 TaxID=3393412 RepID=UPI003CF3350D